MSGAILLLPLCAFMTWTGKTILLPLFLRFVIGQRKSPRIFPDTHDKFVLAAVVVGFCGLRKYVCVCVYIYIYIYIYICMCVCIYVCVYVYMCVCMYVCICVRMYICVYVSIMHVHVCMYV
jgi:hypothetical protein